MSMLGHMSSVPSAAKGALLKDCSVDHVGIRTSARHEQLVDVLFDDRRIWSFWLHRDGDVVSGGRLVRWPKLLRPFLDGVANVVLMDPSSGRVLHEQVVQFGSGAERIAVVNPQGRPLALDKSARLVETFDNRDASQVEPLLAAIDEVLTALREVGLNPFLAYGTALGAIRDGKLIGHDSDADLGYVSAFDHPVDVIGESFRIQRKLADMGYRVTRYSALAIQIHVEESDGLDRGLDVFGGFMRDGILYLMGEITLPFQREWIEPLGTASLEGREFPVPADTDKFLTATYGPGWRTPDPAYKFETPRETITRFNGWFRGMRRGRAGWHGYFKRIRNRPMRSSKLARQLAQANPQAQLFVDIGCGRGADVSLFADRGVRAIGLDYQPYAYAAEAERRGDDALVDFQLFNLLELRHVLAVSAWVARMPGPRVIISRHVVERIGPNGRANLLLAARMMLAGTNDPLHLEFLCRRGRDGYTRRSGVRSALDPEVMSADVIAAGGTVREVFFRDISQGPQSSRVCRMIIEWNSES